MIKACLFDLDGTLIDEKGLLYPNLERILRKRSFKMSILTGRSFPRYMQAVNQNPALIPDMPVALEHGGRIVAWKKGTPNQIFYTPLTTYDHVCIKEYVENQSKKLCSLSFFPEEIQAPPVLWIADRDELLRLNLAHTVGATIYTKDQKEEFFEEMKNKKPSTITCRTSPGTNPEIPEGLHYYTEGRNINFLPVGVDKGIATKIILTYVELSANKVLGVGNDYNDISFLRVVGTPVLVGEDIPKEMLNLLPKNTILIPDKKHLGAEISKMVKKQ
jgi:HAD superfamily hydrolase (TIGR01484 family)